MTRLVAFVAVVMVAFAGSANAMPKTDSNQMNYGKPAMTCPKGKTGIEGVCVASKNGKMGFDLAAPADNNQPAPSSQAASPRGVTKSATKGH
jgi:hypothetical protein